MGKQIAGDREAGLPLVLSKLVNYAGDGGEGYMVVVSSRLYMARV